MKRSAPLLLALGCSLTLLVATAHASEGGVGAILVNAVTAQDEKSATRLAELIDVPIERVTDTGASEPHYACELSRALRRETLVIIDGAARRVHVVRARDCMVLTRRIEGDDLSGYTAAFVAAELLFLEAQLESAPPARVARARSSIGLAGGVDLALAGPYRNRPRLLLSAGIARERPASRVGFELNLASGIHATTERTTRLGSVAARRSDVALRSGPTLRLRRTVWIAFAQLGVTLTSTELARSEVERRAALQAGAGLGVRISLLGPLHLFVQGTGTRSLPRRDYRVGGVSELKDPVLNATLELGLSAYLHSR
jgi:hypothetical protein